MKTIILVISILVSSYSLTGAVETKTEPKDENCTVVVPGALYTPIQQGTSIRVKFHRYTKVRVHTGKGYFPYANAVGYPKHDLIIAKGQWVDILINGKWSFARDLDNRY